MCMVDDGDGYATVLREKQPTARKTHRCCECYRDIKAGETYTLEVALFDGSVSAFKTCTHCKVARDWLRAECGGFVWSGVEEDIREHLGYGYGMGLARVSVAMRNKWARRDGALRPVPSPLNFAKASA